MVRTHWWLRSYSSQALEEYKLKAECLFLICLMPLFALIAIFGVSLILRFVILNLLRLQDAWMAYDRRTETKEERNRTRMTTLIAQMWWKKLLHKFFSLTLNHLLFLRMSYFKWMHISKKWFSYVQE